MSATPKRWYQAVVPKDVIALEGAVHVFWPMVAAFTYTVRSWYRLSLYALPPGPSIGAANWSIDALESRSASYASTWRIHSAVTCSCACSWHRRACVPRPHVEMFRDSVMR